MVLGLFCRFETFSFLPAPSTIIFANLLKLLEFLIPNLGLEVIFRNRTVRRFISQRGSETLKRSLKTVTFQTRPV